jgi:hypothetical protein
MFSVTQRSMPEAKLPKAAWHACVRPNAVLETLQAGRLPGVVLQGGPGCPWDRRTNIGAVASSLGTSDCAALIRAERPYQLPEVLP